MEQLKLFWRHSWKRFLIISLILTLAYSAILLANSYYWDDIFREIQGFRGWQDFSRYASNYLAILFNTSGVLTDASPLTHFIAIGFLSLSCCILIYLFKVKLFNKKPTAFDIIASLLLVLSPYYLECFVYKFDAPYMAISVFATIFPFLFLKSSAKDSQENSPERLESSLPASKPTPIASPSFYIISFLGTLLMCTTYQASSGIFPLLVVAVSLALFHQGHNLKSIFKFLGLSALAYCTAILIFKTFLMAPIDPSYASYVSNSVFEFTDFIPGFFGNLIHYYQYVISDFRKLWLLLSGLITVAFLIFATLRSQRKKLPALLVTLIATALILILPFGLYPALEKPSFDPRAFLGLGAALSIMALYVTSQIRALPGKLAVAALGYCFVVFAFIYGNALRQQDQWNYFRNSTLAGDLSRLEIMTTDAEKTIQIKGSIGVAAPIHNYANSTGAHILERLSFVSLQDSTHPWGYYYLFNYFGLQNISPDKTESTEKLDSLTTLIDTSYHRISASGDHILIELK